MRILCALSLAIFSLNGLAYAQEIRRLDSAVVAVNAEAKARSLALKQISPADVIRVFELESPWSFLRPERESIHAHLLQNELPPNYSLVIDTSYAPRIVLREYKARGWSANLKIVEGDTFNNPVERAREEACSLQENGIRLCEEPFVGPLPEMKNVAFPQNVKVKISQTQATGSTNSFPQDMLEGDVLRIQLLINKENIPALVDYFGVGFSKEFLAKRLEILLGWQRSEMWIDLQQIFPNWVLGRANTFVRFGDNDVCHAAAREFFWQNPSPDDTSYATSTEAVIILLNDFYCPLPDEIEPRFGDYLWIPGRHSGRFLFQDPTSGRGIGFSVQSGGNVPYRFYWVDEDFSGRPFSHAPERDLRKKGLDIWRRCR